MATYSHKYKSMFLKPGEVVHVYPGPNTSYGVFTTPNLRVGTEDWDPEGVEFIEYVKKLPDVTTCKMHEEDVWVMPLNSFLIYKNYLRCQQTIHRVIRNVVTLDQERLAYIRRMVDLKEFPFDEEIENYLIYGTWDRPEFQPIIDKPSVNEVSEKPSVEKENNAEDSRNNLFF